MSKLYFLYFLYLYMGNLKEYWEHPTEHKKAIILIFIIGNILGIVLMALIGIPVIGWILAVPLYILSNLITLGSNIVLIKLIIDLY